jgi:hypothetical protein
MDILYFGAGTGTSAQRVRALGRLGHDVTLCDPRIVFRLVGRGRLWQWLAALHQRTGYWLLLPVVYFWLLFYRPGKHYDVIWVDSGEWFGPHAVRRFHEFGDHVVLFNHDDPTGTRDRRRFSQLKRAVPYYDLVVTVRDQTRKELEMLGARKVLRRFMCYDEIDHAPLKDAPDAGFQSDVVFIGTNIPGDGRDAFLHSLKSAGVPIAIWGDRWDRSPYWADLKSVWRGSSLSGRDYVAAISGAKVCLGLLSSGNRDLHTTRSMEVPYAGGVLCAQRTSEHEQLYEDDREAVFWSDADECVLKCHRLLQDDAFREAVRISGMARVRRNGVGHESLCADVLAIFERGSKS